MRAIVSERNLIIVLFLITVPELVPYLLEVIAVIRILNILGRNSDFICETSRRVGVYSRVRGHDRASLGIHRLASLPDDVANTLRQNPPDGLSCSTKKMKE